MTVDGDPSASGGGLIDGRPLGVELRHLRYFLLVAEEQHFGRAAARAGIDQSPLSRQILDLEDRLGVRLFNRTRRRTTLTPEGQQLTLDVRRILADIQTSVAVVRSIASGIGVPFRFGLAEGAAGAAFGQLLTACASRTPPINLVIIERPSDELFDLMLAGGLDGAITLHAPVIDGLDAACVWHHPMMVAAPCGHWTGLRDSVSLGELVDEAWVLPDPHVLPGYAAQQEAILRTHGVTVGTMIRAGHQNSLLQLIAAGRGISLIPEGISSSIVNLELTPLADIGADVVSWFISPPNASPLLSGVREEIERIAQHGATPCPCERI